MAQRFTKMSSTGIPGALSSYHSFVGNPQIAKALKDDVAALGDALARNYASFFINEAMAVGNAAIFLERGGGYDSLSSKYDLRRYADDPIGAMISTLKGKRPELDGTHSTINVETMLNGLGPLESLMTPGLLAVKHLDSILYGSVVASLAGVVGVISGMEAKNERDNDLRIAWLIDTGRLILEDWLRGRKTN